MISQTRKSANGYGRIDQASSLVAYRFCITEAAKINNTTMTSRNSAGGDWLPVDDVISASPWWKPLSMAWSDTSWIRLLFSKESYSASVDDVGTGTRYPANIQAGTGTLIQKMEHLYTIHNILATVRTTLQSRHTLSPNYYTVTGNYMHRVSENNYVNLSFAPC